MYLYNSANVKINSCARLNALMLNIYAVFLAAHICCVLLRSMAQTVVAIIEN